MIAAGRYIVEVKANGQMVWTPLHQETLEKQWLKDAPFTYQQFIEAMHEKNFLVSGVWNLFQMRGNRRTSSFYVRACYEYLASIGCVPALSHPQITNIFNAFGADINHCRTLSNDCTKESELFHSVFRSLRED